MTDGFDRVDGLKLNRELFNRFAKMIKEKTGIFFDVSKMYFLETKLKKRMKIMGVNDFLSYLMLLESDLLDQEFGKLIDEIVTNETSFFRISSQFRAFEEYVIPDLLERKRNIQSRSLSFLSAGCSTGEETYSIAISVFECLRRFAPDFDFNVVGIDISEKAIKFANNGMYPQLNGFIDDERFDRYFWKQKEAFFVNDILKRRVFFKRGNLIERSEILSSGFFDAIFCRYVLIYLDENAKKRVLENLFSVLQPGGFLFVAPSECYNVPDSFARILYKNAIIFRKPF